MQQFEDTRLNIGERIDVEYKQALNREQMLQKAVAQTKAEFDRLNARSFEYQTLKREAEGDKKLYEELVRKIKEAGINAGFQNNNIRIADLARPAAEASVFPNLKLNLLLALLTASLLAVGAAILSDRLDTTIRDPEQASRYLGTDVVGILPSVKNSAQLARLILSGPGPSAAPTNRASARNGYHERGFYRHWRLRGSDPHAAQYSAPARFPRPASVRF